MKTVDMKSWNRKEIYDFFSSISDPFYMVSFVVDVTQLKEFTKKHNCSFYCSLIYLCCKAMSNIENFLYVVNENKVCMIEQREPSFTDRKQDSELFHIVSIPMQDDIVAFCESAKIASQNQQNFIDLTKEGNNLAYFTCLPTLKLTALTNEFDLLSSGFASDSVPRIAWGKYIEQNGRLELTISMEVNHRFIDGIHIEKFAANLSKMIEELSDK